MATPVLVRSYKAAPAGGSGTVTIAGVDTSGGTLLNIKVTVGYNEGVPNTPTFNGSTTGITLHDSIDAGSNGRAYWWYLNAPSGTADVAVSFTGYCSRTVIIEVWNNTHATTPLKAAAKAEATSGTTPTVTCTTGAVGDVISDLLSMRPTVNGTGSITAQGAGQTLVELADNLVDTGVGAHGASSYEAGGTSVVMDYTLDLANRWGIIAAPIAASEEGGGADPGHYYRRNQASRIGGLS